MESKFVFEQILTIYRERRKKENKLLTPSRTKSKQWLRNEEIHSNLLGYTYSDTLTRGLENISVKRAPAPTISSEKRSYALKLCSFYDSD